MEKGFIRKLREMNGTIQFGECGRDTYTRFYRDTELHGDGSGVSVPLSVDYTNKGFDGSGDARGLGEELDGFGTFSRYTNYLAEPDSTSPHDNLNNFG